MEVSFSFSGKLVLQRQVMLHLGSLGREYGRALWLLKTEWNYIKPLLMMERLWFASFWWEVLLSCLHPLSPDLLSHLRFCPLSLLLMNDLLLWRCFIWLYGQRAMGGGEENLCKVVIKFWMFCSNLTCSYWFSHCILVFRNPFQLHSTQTLKNRKFFNEIISSSYSIPLFLFFLFFICQNN